MKRKDSKVKKEEILEAERQYKNVIREYGYKNWADNGVHRDPESIVLMVILKKVLDIERILKKAKKAGEEE